MKDEEIRNTVKEYAQSARKRTDAYGQSIAGRNRLAIEIAGAMASAIGSERVGIRLSPYGVLNGTGEFPEVEAQYLALRAWLSALRLLYVHLVDHSELVSAEI